MQKTNHIITSRKFIPVLEGIRGLAVIMVFLSHAGRNWSFNYGQFGVYIFFTLSAVLMLMPFFANNTTKITLRSYSSFLIRRAFRIIPVYYVAILCYLFFIDNENITGKQILVNISFLQRVSAQNIFDSQFIEQFAFKVIGQSWTLVKEIQFYILVPFIAVYINRSRLHIIWNLIIICTISYIITIINYLLGGTFFGASIAPFMPLFAAGILVAYYFNRDEVPNVLKIKGYEYNSNLIANLVILTTFTLGTYANFLLYGLGPINVFLLDINPNFIYVTILVVPIISIFLFLVFMLIINNKDHWFTKFLNFDFFIFIGTIGYSIYLFHVLILDLVDVQTPADVFIAFGLVVLVSYFSYILVEKPYIKIGKYLANKIEKKEQNRLSTMFITYISMLSLVIIFGLAVVVYINL